MIGVLTIAVAGASPATEAAAQTARERIVVSSDWLASHLKDADLVVLHVGPADGYAARRPLGQQDLSEP
jgi:hypothetical protein